MSMIRIPVGLPDAPPQHALAGTARALNSNPAKLAAQNLAGRFCAAQSQFAIRKPAGAAVGSVPMSDRGSALVSDEQRTAADQDDAEPVYRREPLA